VIRLLVVDDNAAIRAAVTELCAAAGDVTVVAECIDGSGAADAARHSRPDVVLMDLSMPGTGGLAATREVLAESADARVVVLTGSFSAATIREARAIGAVGYLVKDGDPAELLRGVRAVAAGGTAWGAAAAATLRSHPPNG
jgi:DNA-binding NarL/FixJ family response regulator